MIAFARASLLLVASLALVGAAACGPGNLVDEDAGTEGPGNLLPVVDGGLPPPDAGGPGDSGTADGGVPPDSGPSTDAGLPDGGVNPPDSGVPDSGVPAVMTSGEGGPCYEAAGGRCEAGLVCAPLFTSGAGTCARPCSVEGQVCGGGGVCTSFGEDEVLACATQVQDGAGCDPEQLIVCGGEGVCISDENQPLGGTCRTPCSCPTGTACSTAACGAKACIVTSAAGDGYCGVAAQLGQSCDPVSGGVFCEGNAVCVFDDLGSGTCRSRCQTPGTSDPACSGNSACFGEPGDGFCLPTTNRGQGELCTDGTTTPAIPLSCATGFGCIHDPNFHTAGFGACLEDCSTGGHDVCETGSCYDLQPVIPGGGARCLTEMPRGARGCGGLVNICGDDDGVCVTLSSDDTICKQRCTLAAPTECGSGESCVRYLDSPEFGVCGTLAGYEEACDEDADVYCAPAPGEGTTGNAFSACVERCRFICRYTQNGSPVQLTCPSGMECRPDPTGRLVDTVHVCVETP